MVIRLQTEAQHVLAAAGLLQLQEYAIAKLVEAVAQLTDLVDSLFDPKLAFPWVATSQLMSPAMPCVCTAADPFPSASCVCAGAIPNEYQLGQQSCCHHSCCHNSLTAALQTAGGRLTTTFPGVRAVPGRRNVFEFVDCHTLKHKFANKRQAFECWMLVKLLAQHILDI